MKSKIALGLLAAFVLVLFNILFFSIWENMSTSRWICWGAIHVAGFLFAAAAHSTKMSGDGLIHAYPKMAVSFGMFITMAILGILITIWNPTSWKVPVVLLSLFAFGDIIAYISLMSAEEKTLADGKRDARDRFFIQSCAEQLNEIRLAQTDASIKKQVEKAYDAVRGAQVTTIPEVADIEDKIESLVAKMSGECEAGDTAAVAATASAIVSAVKKRDMEIRMSH